MSTRDIVAYFERYASNKEALVVAWINDSSCTVKFESEEQAKKAYKEQALSVSKEEEQSNQLHIGQAIVDGTSEEVDPRNFDQDLGWKEALGFQLTSSARWQKLWIRAATDRDVKDENTKGENSRFY